MILIVPRLMKEGACGREHSGRVSPNSLARSRVVGGLPIAEHVRLVHASSVLHHAQQAGSHDIAPGIVPTVLIHFLSIDEHVAM